MEEQATTGGCGGSPGRPEVASLADVHNSTGAVVCIPIPQAIKEYSASRFPTIGVEEISLAEATTNIELTTI